MKKIVVFIIFILIGSGIYFNSLKNGFHYDDGHHIYDNPYIRTLSNIPLFFAEPRTLSIKSTLHPHYRPLVMTSYAINYHLGKFNPPGYHMVNLAFHIGSAFLLFLILQAILTPHPIPPPQGGREKRGGTLFIPIAAGILFLTTPYNSEVVNYITARSTVMCTFFYLMAFYFWVKFRRGGRQGVYFYYTASLFAFILAMLTKEIAITLPAMLWLYDLYFEEREDRLSSAGLYNRLKHCRVYIPFAMIGFFAGIVTRIIFFGSFITENRINRLLHFLIEVKVLAKYFTHMAIPVNLSAEHTIQETLNIYFFLSLLLIISLLALAYLLWRRRTPLWRTASFFIAWFFLALLPTSFISLSAPYQENRGYLSAIGFVALTAMGLERLIKKIFSPENRQALIGYSLIGLLVITFSIGVVQRNRVWLNTETLWSDVIKKYPESTGANLELARYYGAKGQMDLALDKYNAVATLEPDDPEVLARMGAFYLLKKGDAEKAEEYFKSSIKINPGNFLANLYMARILQSRGELELAYWHIIRALYNTPDNTGIITILMDICKKMGNLDTCYQGALKAKETDPDNPAIMRSLGLIHMEMGHWKEAAKEFEAVLSYMPDDAMTLLDLGHVYSKMGFMELAEEKHRRALEINPKDTEAYLSLAIIYQEQGKFDKALFLYMKVLEADPNSYKTYNNIGLLYSLKGEDEKAIEAYRKALEINPMYHLARFNLARLYAKEGKKEQAIKEYKKIMDMASQEGKDNGIYLAVKTRLADLERPNSHKGNKTY